MAGTIPGKRHFSGHEEMTLSLFCAKTQLKNEMGN